MTSDFCISDLLGCTVSKWHAVLISCMISCMEMPQICPPKSTMWWASRINRPSFCKKAITWPQSWWAPPPSTHLPILGWQWNLRSNKDMHATAVFQSHTYVSQMASYGIFRLMKLQKVYCTECVSVIGGAKRVHILSLRPSKCLLQIVTTWILVSSKSDTLWTYGLTLCWLYVMKNT